MNDKTLSKEAPKIRKIWVAMSTPFQANFFAPLIKELENDYEFLVTAREHDNILSILQAKHIDYVTTGKHGGKLLGDKLEAYAQAIQQMHPIIQKAKPDLMLTERWPEAVRVAFGLNIPAWTIFYDERERHVNQMVFPLASKVFVPRFYDFQELYQHGVTDLDNVIWFNGFHTAYLKGAQMATEDPFKKIGIDPPVVFVRPEPEFAAFFPDRRPVLQNAVELIAKKGNATVAVLPRTEKQAQLYSGMKDVRVIDSSMVDSPVAHATVAMGAAETMLMEAFVLGKPAVSAVYWEASKPVVELHRYIPHSTDPVQIARYVENFMDEGEQKSFMEKASLIVKTMDNPVRFMIDEIRKMNAGVRNEVAFKRRSRMETMVDVLQAAALRPLRPTHIMKEANISYNELRSFIEDLERKGLIRLEATLGGKYYQATSDGLQVLQDYKRFRERLLE
jgi:predicted glycosyltransferase/predicted transcriptional regulator